MQKLDTRNTSMRISYAHRNCGQSLKDFRGKICLVDIATVSNNSDAILTVGIDGREKHVSIIYYPVFKYKRSSVSSPCLTTRISTLSI